MYSRLVAPCLLLILLAAPARASAAAEGDGFRLGRLATDTKELAADLHYLARLAESYAIGKEEVVATDASNTDFALAGGALTYAIWRVELSVLPSCEEWQKDKVLDNAPLRAYRDPLRGLLKTLQKDCEKFRDGVKAGDNKALTSFVTRLQSEDYVERLLDISDRATLQAGEEPTR